MTLSWSHGSHLVACEPNELLGDWYDSDGNNVTFTNWNDGQPNSYNGDQDYAAISYAPNKWGDFHGDTRGQVICLQQILSKFFSNCDVLFS